MSEVTAWASESPSQIILMLRYETERNLVSQYLAINFAQMLNR